MPDRFVDVPGLVQEPEDVDHFLGSLDEPEPQFVAFPKIARLRREIVITEKIDGTNAAVGVTEAGVVYAQSRKRIITTDIDNAGFARWVAEHADLLRVELGPGLHFGEWWGSGIQRGYGLTGGDKVFSLFNTSRWLPARLDGSLVTCNVVPVIGVYPTFNTAFVESAIQFLRDGGSRAQPGYDKPEGVVIFHPQSNHLFKQTLEGDDSGKEHGS